MYIIFQRMLLITSSVIMFMMTLHIVLPENTAAYGYGTLQTAMGGTAVARSDNAMNLATNPASMAFGRDNLTVGLEVLVPDREATLGTTKLDGNRDRAFLLPEFAYQKTVNDKFAIGLAVYGSSGSNVFYDTAIFAAPATSPNTGLDFSSIFISPSLSIKTSEHSAFGFSVNLVYQRIELAGAGGVTAFSTDPTNFSDKGHDNATGIGLTLGWQGKIASRVKAGIAYRAETSMQRFDKYKGAFAEQGKFNTPSMLTLGISVEATPKMTFAMDVSHIDYDSIKFLANPNNSAALVDANGNPDPNLVAANGYGSDNGAGFGWDDQNIIKLGIDYKWNEKITLLGGFSHRNSPINNDQTVFNILAPATIEDALTLGLDWTLTKNSSVVMQYTHAFKNKIKGSSTASGSQTVTSDSTFAIVDIETKLNAVAISYTREF